MHSWVYYHPQFDELEIDSPWFGHKYFAYDLVANLKFKKIVELGSFTGCSFSAFCLAVKDQKFKSKLFAIDTWKGDKHAGFYGEEVFAEFKKKMDDNFSAQTIYILRNTFDNALNNFKEHEIELLHIDGLHTYEAVKHDFETWLPKMVLNGVILLHDIHEHAADFGVYKLWEELKSKYTTLEFSHSHGLGVVFLSSEMGQEYIANESAWQQYYNYKYSIELQNRHNRKQQKIETDQQLNLIEILKNEIQELNNQKLNFDLLLKEQKNQNLVLSNLILNLNKQIQINARKFRNFKGLIFKKQLQLEDTEFCLHEFRVLAHELNLKIQNLVSESEKYNLELINLKNSFSCKLGFMLTLLPRKFYDKFLSQTTKVNFENLFKAKKFRIKTKLPIDIIIPVYNGFEYLEPLFSSLKQNTTIPYRLIVINDASPDPRVAKFLQSQKINFKHFLLLTNEQNFGFVQSVNRGMHMANNHFVILNTDTELPANWLERLMYPIFKYKNIATTTPFTNAGTICSFPHFLQDNDIFEGLTLHEIDSQFKDLNYPISELEIPTGVGFCMGMNKKVLDLIGFFDAETFDKGYGEENDWCMKAKSRGFKNIIVPNLFVYHKHGGSFLSQEKQALLEKNSILLNAKHPTYQAKVQEYITKNPLQLVRQILVFRTLALKEQLCITSDPGLTTQILNKPVLLIENGKYIFHYKSYSLEVPVELTSKILTIFPYKNISCDLQDKVATSFLQMPKQRSQKNILLFDHVLGGGANFYASKQINKYLERNYKVYKVEFSPHTKRFTLSVISQTITQKYLFDSIHQLPNLIDLTKIEEAFLNEIVSYENTCELLNTFQSWIDKYHLKLTFLIHDYFSVCPSFTLVDKNKKFCNVPNLKVCAKCLPKLQFDPALAIENKITVKEWRQAWFGLLQKVNKIVCFSESSKNIFAKAYPDLVSKVVIVPHEIDYLPATQLVYPVDPKQFNIAVLGNLHSEGKGAKILQETAQKLKNYPDIKIHIIGNTYEELFTANMSLYGAYKQSELPNILSSLKIDLVFIPSIWSETFSYTTNEAIQLGIKVIVFDIGAQAEYVKKYDKGYTIESIDPVAASNAIIKLLVAEREGFEPSQAFTPLTR